MCVIHTLTLLYSQRQQTDPSFELDRTEDDPEEDEEPEEDNDDKPVDDEHDPIGVPPRDVHSLAS